MSSPGRVVVLNGTSCAGKTSLARALTSQLSGQGSYWYCLDMDVALWGIPKAWWMWPGHSGSHADRGVGHSPGRKEEFHVGPDARRTLHAFRLVARHLAEDGVNVVVACILFDSLEWKQWCEALAGLPVAWVAVRAPRDVVRAREEARNESYWPGLAADYADLAHRFPAYDHEVDTTAAEPDALARQLAPLLVQS